jgi:conjugal transfer pilus assembly protein TraD
VTPRVGPATPRTWFRSRPTGAPRDLEGELRDGIAGFVVLVLAPVVLAVGLVSYVGAKFLRLRWWWLAAAGAGALSFQLVGAHAALAGYWNPYVDVARAFRDAKGPGLHLGGLVGSHLGSWARAQLPLAVPLGLLAGAGGRLRAEMRRSTWRERPAPAPSPKTISSAVTAFPAPDQSGPIRLGVSLTDGSVVDLTEDQLRAHTLTVGATGSGKSTTLLRLVWEAVAKALAVIAVDLKGDAHFRADMEKLAWSQGRRFTVWTLTGDARWNPLARGDRSSRADKLVATEEWSEPHYKRAAERYLQLAFAVLEAANAGTPPSLGDVVVLLEPKALEAMAVALPVEHDELRNRVRSYLASLDPGQASGVRGLATRLAVLVESTSGEYLQPDPGGATLDLLDTILAGDVVLFSLDSLAYAEKAKQVANLIVQDLQAVAGLLLASGAADEPMKALVVIDEFSAMDSDRLLGLLVRARGAGLGVVLSTQELADLSRAAEGFDAQVFGNTCCKLVHRQDVPESADRFAAAIGTEMKWEETMQVEHATGVLSHDRGAATGMGSLRRVDHFKVHPNEIKELPKGTVVLLTKEPHVRVDRVRVVPAVTR